MLDVQVDFAAGSMFDPAGKSGLAALTRATLDNGAGKLDETAIAEQLADLGASLGGGPTPTAPASRCARCHPRQARSGARHPEDRGTGPCSMQPFSSGKRPAPSPASRRQ
jgi:hypothetical protein